MFCHACGGVWLRNEGGLTCPTCQSEFTEIVRRPSMFSALQRLIRRQIEIPPDTEAPDPPEEAPQERSSPGNPFANHNPWANTSRDAPEDSFFSDLGGIGGARRWPESGLNRHTYRSPDGRFTFTTSYHTGIPRRQSTDPQGNPDPLMPVVRGLDSIFHGLANTYQQTDPQRLRSQQGPQPWGPGHGHDGDAPHGPGQRRAPGAMDDGSFDFGLRYGGGSDFHDDGLHPRDADGPQPMNTPLRSLGEYEHPPNPAPLNSRMRLETVRTNYRSMLELFRTDFGANNQTGNGGFRVMTGPNPLAMLSTLLNAERHGDVVYSQEELDRVISQLVDQNASGSAAPPASQNAIRSLPKKKVDQDMLGNEGKAECSICMDPAEIGTEVTVLPCKHWFHYSCIEMWLAQHNTCPHCRRGINDAPSEGTSDNPVVIDSSPEASRRSSAVPEHSGQSGWGWGWGAEGDSDRRGSNQGGGLTGWIRRFGGN